MARSDSDFASPVFIVGMPRSGTSLLEQVLGCHPKIVPGGERQEMSWAVLEAFADRSIEESFPAEAGKLSKDVLNATAAQYAQRIGTVLGQATHMTDKMPPNILKLGFIAQVLPKARIIHCTRDALDCCWSCYTRNLGLGYEYARDLGMLGRCYASQQDLMRHWKSVLDLQILDVAYEDVVADLEGQTRRVLDFLGLPFDSACLEFHASARRVQTASIDQVRKPIYSSSVGRAHRYREHLEPLCNALTNAGIPVNEP